jgi:hypothetical protein
MSCDIQNVEEDNNNNNNKMRMMRMKSIPKDSKAVFGQQQNGVELSGVE